MLPDRPSVTQLFSNEVEHNVQIRIGPDERPSGGTCHRLHPIRRQYSSLQSWYAQYTCQQATSALQPNSIRKLTCIRDVRIHRSAPPSYRSGSLLPLKSPTLMRERGVGSRSRKRREWLVISVRCRIRRGRRRSSGGYDVVGTFKVGGVKI